MANGLILDSFLYGPTPGLSANVPRDAPLPLEARGGLLTTISQAGDLTNEQPITIRSIAETGSLAASFADDWYNRIHISPPRIDFGPVVGGSASQTIIWNAYLSNTLLSSITAQNDDGLTLSGLTTPKTYKPLEYTILTVTADVDGQMTITAEYDFLFSGRPDQIALNVAGTRAHIWPFLPNWREPVDVSLEFKTDLIVSRSGREQRRGLRRTPRRSIKYTVTMNRLDMQVFRRLLATWQSRAWVLGDPTRKTIAPLGAPSGSSQFAVEDMPSWISEDQPILIGTDLVATVDSIDPDTGIVTLTGPLANALTQGTIIRPALSGHFSGDIQADHPSSGSAETQITLAVTPGSEPPNEGAYSYATLEGREVMLLKPNWGESVQDTFNWNNETVDFGFGRISTTNPIAFGTVIRNATFVQQTPDQAEDLAQFYARQRGRRGEFLMPTWLNDLPPKNALVGGTNFLRIDGPEVALAYQNDAVFQSVAVILTGDRRIYREVDTIETVSDTEGTDTVIHFTENWLVDVDLSEILMASWMPVVRFSADQLTIEWLTTEVAQTQLSMQSLEYLPAEDPLPSVDGAAKYMLEVWGFDAGSKIIDALDFEVNLHYPSIFFVPEAWSYLYEDTIDKLGKFIVRYAEITL